MANIIQVRRDTVANWESLNPLLTQGEIGLELGTQKFKFGDGTTRWLTLPYALDTANQEVYHGTVEIDFGATPTDEATVVLTGITQITATSNIQVFIVGDDTTVDNTAVDHDGLTYMAILHAGARVVGVGFTITARVWNGLASGKFLVHYSFTN